MSDHVAMRWLVWYADLFATIDRCAYCWWLRGVLFHVGATVVAFGAAIGGTAIGATLGVMLLFYTMYLWSTRG